MLQQVQEWLPNQVSEFIGGATLLGSHQVGSLCRHNSRDRNYGIERKFRSMQREQLGNRWNMKWLWEQWGRNGLKYYLAGMRLIPDQCLVNKYLMNWRQSYPKPVFCTQVESEARDLNIFLHFFLLSGVKLWKGYRTRWQFSAIAIKCSPS